VIVYENKPSYIGLIGVLMFLYHRCNSIFIGPLVVQPIVKLSFENVLISELLIALGISFYLLMHIAYISFI